MSHSDAAAAASALERDEIRARKNRENVARHKAKMDSLSFVEQAAWKARASLGEGFDPYTAEERQRLEQINDLITELQAQARALNQDLLARYMELLPAHPEYAPIIGALSGKEKRIDLPPV